MRNWFKNVLYLVPFIYFFIAALYWGIRLILLPPLIWNVPFNFFQFLYSWGSLVDENLLTVHSFFIFHISSCPWIFLIFYFQKIKTLQFRSINKTISIFVLFWFNLIIFSWLAGLSSYRGFWFTIHSLIIVWGYIGLFCSVLAIIFSVSIRIKSRFNAIFQKVNNIRLFSFLEKYESLFLIAMQFLIGIYLSISDAIIPTRIHGSYIFLTSLMIIVFTIIAVDLLFLFNFILSLNKEYFIRPIKDEREETQKKYEILLHNTRRIISKNYKKQPPKSFDKIIYSLEETIKAFDRETNTLTSNEDQIILQKINKSLINVYNKRAEIYESSGLKSYQKYLLHQAHNQWNAAIKDYKLCLKLIKKQNNTDSIENYEKSISHLRNLLNPLKIEILILETDNKLKELKNNRSLKKKNLMKAIETVNNIILSYSEAKEKADLSDELKDIQEKLESRIQTTQLFRSHLQEKMDESIGLREIPAILSERDRDSILSIIREYEFIGGQIRFKVGIINNTSYTFTNLRLAFDLPKALKWIIHEPKYERRGDSILISKLGAHEKQAVSLYLEPINCMESSVNVTVSFFDAKEKPHAVPMKPKMIAISCPIFFTEDEANLARVKSLRRSLGNRDKKVFPIADPAKAASIFSSILSVLGKFDIKLVYKEFDEDINYGEAWFYGMTKVKKNRIIPHIMLDSNNKVLEFEVAGDDAEQITSFLAEIGDRVRRKLIQDKVIKPEEKFFDMRITVMSNFCPYCYTLISDESVQKFLNGESINCKNCSAIINLDER
ncbi:MAG: hypothetical protein ACFFEY_05240 [Candidatus Thorarchaeota archaeon]